MLATSADGATVYFATEKKLTADSTGVDGENAYVYRWNASDGLEFVAAVNSQDQPNWLDRRDMGPASRMSPDGRFLLLDTAEKMTAYETNELPQVYLYDHVKQGIDCISCSPRSASSQGGATLTTHLVNSSGGSKHPPYTFPPHDLSTELLRNPDGYVSRNLADDGSHVVFDSGDDLTANDANGATDVYVWRDGQLSLVSSGNSRARSPSSSTPVVTVATSSSPLASR